MPSKNLNIIFKHMQSNTSTFVIENILRKDTLNRRNFYRDRERVRNRERESEGKGKGQGTKTEPGRGMG
jgi:hypothetical protein